MFTANPAYCDGWETNEEDKKCNCPPLKRLAQVFTCHKIKTFRASFTRPPPISSEIAANNLIINIAKLRYCISNICSVIKFCNGNRSLWTQYVYFTVAWEIFNFMIETHVVTANPLVVLDFQTWTLKIYLIRQGLPRARCFNYWRQKILRVFIYSIKQIRLFRLYLYFCIVEIHCLFHCSKLKS